jgi:hypothetical protein
MITVAIINRVECVAGKVATQKKAKPPSLTRIASIRKREGIYELKPEAVQQKRADPPRQNSIGVTG